MPIKNPSLNGSIRYPEALKERAVAMFAQGVSAKQVGITLDIPENTIRVWRQRYQRVTNDDTGLIDDWRRITARAQALLHDSLDALEEGNYTHPLLRLLVPLNVVAGTGTDKVQASQRAESSPLSILIGEVQLTLQQAPPQLTARSNADIDGEILATLD